MGETLDTVLLLALPASGKSEVRRYLSHLSPDECRDGFHMGPTVQLDDFPYVHMMRLIDDEIAALGKDRLFFEAPDKSFADGRDWGTLISLISEDYDDLLAKKVQTPNSAADLMMQRLDSASERVGLPRRCETLDEGTRKAVCDKLEKEAGDLLKEKHDNYPDTLEGKTIVIEFARGGPQGASMPLPTPHGYLYSLAQLSDTILARSSALYVWVTPEESRRKNDARADPDDPGSILHHGVPMAVMLGEYGCDDMDWLEENAEQPGTIMVEAWGKKYHLRVGRFDNRVDKTSFIRDDPKDWKPEDVKAIHEGLKVALDKIAGV